MRSALPASRRRLTYGVGCVQLLVLALEAALYPTLLAAVVILLSQPRRLRLLGAYLAGGLTISIGLGLAIVAALEGSGQLNNEKSGLSWRADIVVGGLALLLAVALATPGGRAIQGAQEGRPAAEGRAVKEDREPWSQRVLARGLHPIVFFAGIAINLPGAAYLVALKDIAAGDNSTAEAIALVLAFNLIMFMLAEIPLLGLIFAPDRTGDLVARMDRWLSSNGRRIAIVLCAVLGAFLIARGIAHS